MKQLAELFEQGGAAMWMIAVVSVAAWLLAFKLWKTARFILSDLTQARDFLYELPRKPYQPSDGKTESAFPLLNRVAMEVSGKAAGAKTERKENKLTIENEIRGLRGSLGLLAAMAGVLPLLGLLGTVLGMLVTFNVIERYGTGEPALLADGIRQALLTTEVGLLAALIVLFFHHILSSRFKAIDVELNLVFRRLEEMNGNNKLQKH